MEDGKETRDWLLSLSADKYCICTTRKCAKFQNYAAMLPLSKKLSTNILSILLAVHVGPPPAKTCRSKKKEDFGSARSNCVGILEGCAGGYSLLRFPPLRPGGHRKNENRWRWTEQPCS